MGVINRGILGGFRGKVANVVGSAWKGIDTMRALPTSVANPRTAAQVAQRNAFSGVVALAKLLLLSIIKPAWDRFAVKMSGYNEFVSANIAAFSNLGVPTYADLKMAVGKLIGFDNLSADFTAGAGGVDLSWDDNAGTGNALPGDESYYVIINSTKDVTDSGKVEEGTRDSLGNTVGTPAGSEIGDTIHLYVFFRSVDGTRVSNSEYLTGVLS